ncbi:WD40 repeat domain-containing protein [Streptomyces sp. SA15]|uniref:caspase family protein n=1 Tax=Streptomyces sp. SA15 TaxID=934019 RepID=UPI0015C7BA60|nr:WD40 repeat domain-containing protein [Streptomyces sp. SA15]
MIATAVAHYKEQPEWNRPGLVEARQNIIDLFTDRFGYQHVSDLGLDPTESQLTERLRAFCKSPARHEDDLIVVYIAGHGEVLDEEDGGGHVLLTSETDPNDIADALPTETLARKMLAGTRVRRLLLMLDTCYAGQGGNELAAVALERTSRRWSAQPGSGLIILSSAQPLQQAEAGAFPRRLVRAVDSLITAGHGPRTLALDAVVQQMNAAPGYQHVSLLQVGLAGETPPFLPNPRHDPDLTEVDLSVQQEASWRRQADLRDTELQSRFLVRARASRGTDRTAWWFTGRSTALADIATWLRHPPGQVTAPALAVTAGPGSGKTALLGLFAALAHSELRHTVPTHALGLKHCVEQAASYIDVAIYAQSQTDQQVLAGISSAAKVNAPTVGRLLEALSGRGRPLTVMVDALDEAASPETLCVTILRPLIQHSNGRIRLLLGTRPHLLPQLGLQRHEQIDLDAERYADAEAILAYTIRNLVSANPKSPYRRHSLSAWLPIATEVAKAAGHSFLIARITAGTLAATPHVPDHRDHNWRSSLPRHAGHAMAHDLSVRLSVDADRATDLLRPLAYAYGQGLPWEDVWARLATTISGRSYTDEDIQWLRRVAGSYIIEAVEDDRSAYRLYHQSLAEYLRSGIDSTAVHAAFVSTLTSRVPQAVDGDLNWNHAHPYTLRNLAAHATQGNVLDGILREPEFLVHAAPDGLAPYLRQAQTELGELSSAVYLASIGVHRHLAPNARRRLLAIDAVRYNANLLASALKSRMDPETWRPVHATGGDVSPALMNTLVKHESSVYRVACTELDGRPIAVTTTDGEVWVWDLLSGRLRGTPLAGHADAIVDELAVLSVDGRLVAVTGGHDGTVRAWDLIAAQQIGEPLVEKYWVSDIACATVNGQPIVIAAGDDGTVRMWDLATRQSIENRLAGHRSKVSSIACTIVNGRSVAVTGEENGTIQAWDLASGRSFGQPLIGQDRRLFSVTCATLDGRAIAISSGGGIAEVWDLEAGRLVGEPFTPHHDSSGPIVEITDLDGHCTALTSGDDGTVQPWRLATRKPIGDLLVGHEDFVNDIACTELEGRPVAVTGGSDGTVRVWDLASRRSVGSPLTGHREIVFASACADIEGRPVAITGARDGVVKLWDLTSGRSIGEPLTIARGEVQAVACAVVAGQPLAVTCSYGGAVQLWDLASRRFVGELLGTGSSDVSAVACATVDGQPIAITGRRDGTIQLWDLSSRKPIGQLPTTARGGARAVACSMVDGKLVIIACGTDDRGRVWASLFQQTIDDILDGSDGVAEWCDAMLPDERSVANSDLEHKVLVLDIASKKPGDHGDSLNDVTCALMGGRPVALTGSTDGTVRLWDLITQRCLDTFLLPGTCTSLAANDNFLIAAFGADIAAFEKFH